MGGEYDVVFFVLIPFIASIFLFAICQERTTTWLKQQQQMVKETLTLEELDAICEVKKELKQIKIELIYSR